MVSIAVVVILTLLVSQIIGMASKAITSSSKQLDSASGARMAFNRLEMDLAACSIRSDLPVAFSKGTGNDTIGFYSGVQGYSGTRGVSVVGYRIQETNANRYFQLERGVQGDDWSGASGVVFQSKTLPNIADANYDVLADAAFRFEFCYLKTDGTLSNTAQSDLSDVSAIVVGIAAVDGKSRKLLKNADYATLVNALHDPDEGEAPITRWHADMSQKDFAKGVAPAAVQAIRLYQRTFYVK